MTSLFNYLNLIKEQNKVSKYPKVHYAFNYKKFNEGVETVIEKVTNNNVIFTGVIKTETPLYFNTEDIYYYEFLHSVNNTNKFSSWNYYYIDKSNVEEIKYKLPFINIIDFDKSIIKKEYFNNLSLQKLKTGRSNFIENEVYEDNKHPLLGHFLFTGRVVVIYNNLYYEYYDSKEIYDSAEVNYISNLAPINLRPSFELSTKLSIYPAQEDIAPSNIYIKNTNRRFNFTGQMNNTLLKNRVLYKYIEFVENVPFTIFLLDKPFYGNKDLINYSLGLKKNIALNITNNTSRIKIKQNSNIILTINKR